MPDSLRDLVDLSVVVDTTYDQNSYVLRRRDTTEAIVFDPGLQTPLILELLERGGLHCQRIMVTHGHGDHVNGVPRLKAAHGCTAAIHPFDREQLAFVTMLPGIPRDLPPIEFEDDLVPGEVHHWQGLEIEVLHTPGHTRGSVCFHVGEDLVAGDTLFQRSIGRTDLPGGSFDTLMISIERTLYALPPETVVHPGHGPSTTIRDEMRHNPFVVHPRFR